MFSNPTHPPSIGVFDQLWRGVFVTNLKNVDEHLRVVVPLQGQVDLHQLAFGELELIARRSRLLRHEEAPLPVRRSNLDRFVDRVYGSVQPRLSDLGLVEAGLRQGSFVLLVGCFCTEQVRDWWSRARRKDGPHTKEAAETGRNPASFRSH